MTLTLNISVFYETVSIILPSGLSDDNDDYGDDFEALRAIQHRFAQYNASMINCIQSCVQNPEQVGATKNIDLGKESSPNFFVNNRQGFPDYVDGIVSNQNFDISSKLVQNEGHDCGFPRSAQTFVEAIKKNRTNQKFIRNKLVEIEARMEENRKLRERVKILNDFHMACRKRTGRALSQKKDAHIQLISVPKQRANASKAKDKSSHAMYQGPSENSHVANYRDAISKYPFSLTREHWSKQDNGNLLKGIKQQFQEMLMQNLFSAEDADSCYLDSVISEIRDHEITPEQIRSFLSKVNWGQLASMYIKGRSGPETQSRWMNCEDPLINRESWTTEDDKKLLNIVSKQGMSNWIEITKEMKTNRTPFQCLSRFQRSLNASIIKNEWTPLEDDELRNSVAEFGETNWQLVASTLEGRTGTQCSNRWKKSLNPLRERVGKWGPDEDKRLKITVTLFGAKNWNKICKFVPGRTQVQCRERWVNCLDPSLNMNSWTEEEDLKLVKAIEEHKYSWSRIAACIPPRTDSQCLRRWKVLRPHHVPMLQAYRKVKKVAFISNFVDRVDERPTLTVKDFITPLQIESHPKTIQHPNTTSENKKKRLRPEQCEDDSSLRTLFKIRSRRARKVTHTEEVSKLIEEDDGHADITTDGVGPTTFHVDSSEIKKNATWKCKGKERSVFKIRSRRDRQVTYTEKVMKLIDEDDVEDKHGHADITVNGKRRGNTEDKETDGTLQRDPVSKNKTMRPCWRAHGIDVQVEDTLTTNSLPLNKVCSITASENVKTRENSKLLNKRTILSHSIRKRSGYCETVEEEEDYEETLGHFLSKVKKKKKRRLQ